MNRFSIHNNMEKANKKKKEMNDTTAKINLQIEERGQKDFIGEEVVEPLLRFGFSIEQIMTAFKIYKFLTVDEAVYILMRDTETGKFHHRFLKMQDMQNEKGYEGVVNIARNNNECMLCGEAVYDHIDFELEHNEKEVRIDMNMNTNVNNNNLEDGGKDTSVNFDKTIPQNKTTDISGISGIMDKKLNLQIQQIEIPKETLELFEDPDICRICFSEVLNDNNKAQFACGHKFCKTCVSNHLNTNIVNGKVVKKIYTGL
jgi:hypothetical protein